MLLFCSIFVLLILVIELFVVVGVSISFIVMFCYYLDLFKLYSVIFILILESYNIFYICICII